MATPTDGDNDPRSQMDQIKDARAFVDLATLPRAEALYRTEEELNKEAMAARVVHSIAETVDNRAMQTLILLEAGFNAAESQDFINNNEPAHSPILENLSPQERNETILRVSRIAVAEVRRIMAMTEDNKTQLSPEELARINEFLHSVDYLLDSIYVEATHADIGNGISMEALKNLNNDVTHAERMAGEPHPAQPNLRKTLLEVVDGDLERFDVIAEASGLIPARMRNLLIFKAVPKQMADDMKRFLDKWLNRPEINDMALQVAAKGIVALHQIGADIDLAYTLKGYSPKAIPEQIEVFQPGIQADLDQLVPHFTGLTIEQAHTARLTWVDLLQASRRHAAGQDGNDNYAEPIETASDVLAKLAKAQKTAGELLPLLKVIGQSATFSASSSPYAEARASQIAMIRQTSTGESEQTVFTHTDPAGMSTSDLTLTIAHEQAAHAAESEIRKRMVAAGIINAHQMQADAPESEFFAQLMETAVAKAIPADDRTENEQPPFPGELKDPQRGSSLYDSYVGPRQYAFGWVNVDLQRQIEASITSNPTQQKLPPYALDELTRYGNRHIKTSYSFIFATLDITSHDFQSIPANLNVPGDGLFYTAIKPEPVIKMAKTEETAPNKDTENTTGEKPEMQDEQPTIDIKTSANNSLTNRFGEKWVANPEGRALYYGLMMFTAAHPDQSSWLDYLNTTSPDDARAELATIGITADQL